MWPEDRQKVKAMERSNQESGNPTLERARDSWNLIEKRIPILVRKTLGLPVLNLLDFANITSVRAGAKTWP